jgi:hypothetical protein
VDPRQEHRSTPRIGLGGTQHHAHRHAYGISLGPLVHEFAQRAIVELQDCIGNSAQRHGMSLGPTEIAEQAVGVIHDAKRLADES